MTKIEFRHTRTKLKAHSCLILRRQVTNENCLKNRTQKLASLTIVTTWPSSTSAATWYPLALGWPGHVCMLWIISLTLTPDRNCYVSKRLNHTVWAQLSQRKAAIVKCGKPNSGSRWKNSAPRTLGRSLPTRLFHDRQELISTIPTW